MYILFKAVSEKQQGIVQTVGRVLTYTVGYLPDTHTDIADYAHLNPRTLTEPVALAWKFFGAYREYISVRAGSLQNDQLQILATTEATEKAKYYLTEDDKANTVEFMRELMRKMLDEVYEKRFYGANLPTTTLEGSTWPQQRAEALALQADPNAFVPTLTVLAAVRGITVQEMGQKVLTAIEKFNETIAALLASKQLVELDIKSCKTIADCNRLLHNRFDISVTNDQREDEGITTQSKLDL